MKKLVNQTLLYYSILAFVLLLISAPVFYWFSEKLYVEDVDEAIMLRKEEFFQNSLRNLKKNDIPTWNRFNRDTYILPDTVKQIKSKIIQQQFYDTLDHEWEPYRVIYCDIKIEDGNYVLMKRLDLVESEDLIRTTGFLYLTILFVLLSSFILVSKIVSSRLWKPFYQTLSQIEKFNIEEHLLPKFTSSTTKEFEQLNSVIQKLIEQNIKAFQQQKEFTENAAHELQTPLAIFQSKLDMLLQHPSLTEDQALIIQQLYEAVSRLSRVNKNLLLLAKIENDQFSEKENFEVTSIIKAVLPYFEEQAEDKKLQVQTDFNEPITIQANKGLTEILINNLLLNAVRHNVENGRLRIQTVNRQLIISNTGNNEALNPHSIFRRFAKFSEDSHSSGLGLAIVKKIADLNGWALSYSFNENLHIFSLQF